jgi:ATP-dependent Clp protease ATP-binding subunit ClpC
MTFNQFRTQALNEYYPALFLENLWPRARGLHVLQIVRVFWIVLLVTTGLVYMLAQTSMEELELFVPKLFGGFLLVFSVWMVMGAVHAFYNAYYFKTQTAKESKRPRMSFEVARIVYQTSEKDILAGFLESYEGFEIMRRAGITKEDVAAFLTKRTIFIDGDKMSLPEEGYVSAADLAGAILDTDQAFTQFIFSKGIQKKDFLALTEWVFEKEIARRAKQRWWSKEALGRIPGLGKNWSYGQTYTVEKFAREIPVIDGNEYEVHDVYGSKELKSLEAVLVKNREANALIVGNDKEGNTHIIARLARMIDDGTAMLELQHRRLIMLNTEILSASAKSKPDFETLMLTVLTEAHNAGNVILIFDDFPSLVSSAESLGADLPAILDPYLSSQSLQIVGLSDVDRFHAKIERNAALMERFEHILVQDVDASNTIRVLENEVAKLEAQTGLLFTYPALVAIEDSAERYFPDAIMPDQAIDLLFELTPKLVSRGKTIVLKTDVLDLVKAKTGIPMGEVTQDEREKLLGLENLLHKRVIGQDEAVDAISSAVRRARSGINNPNRPMASFLFLGPTGVGKTETTKALAEVFFGKTAEILRLDMSEYSTPDALAKLIGSFANGRSGVLATILREHPYGVLLLDEFEKTTPEVMNLFLQILDEGFFSDMEGKRINARNLLIIATSNAGSELIWESVKHGESLDHAKDMIIDSIISAHIMKPELLNRFDGVIIFHPLGPEHLEKIARLQLEKLKTRLAERGLNLAITDDLVSYLMHYGMDPKFGARPMNRAIQDKIEQIIAEKMIRGDISPGAEIALTSADLRD